MRYEHITGKGLTRFVGGIFFSLVSSAVLSQVPGFEVLFAESCSDCHGSSLEGTATGSALVGTELRHGSSIEALVHSIASGFPQSGMPAMSEILDAGQIQGLAIMISEQRAQLSYADFKVSTPLQIPQGIQSTARHDFRIETVATGLDPFPFSISPLPDGSILVTEKTKGLRLVSREGEVSDLIEGTPTVYDDSFQIPELLFIVGSGWLMEVAVDPDYADNSWIYLHFGDRCSDCNAMSRESGLPVSMNTLVRGRIRDGVWVDQETLWQAPLEQYTWMTDQAAGGRIAFDDAGHLYFSVGMKGPGNYVGIQNLDMPYGKIHRINRDGSIPADNPFLNTLGALPSIWSYGHRSPQGLEFNGLTEQLWGTEMGPRGGDEINLLLPGRNYGWPLYSKGMNYDGTPVNYGELLGIEVDLNEIEQPVVDLTPAPAVSSFIFYVGEQFPMWQHNMLVGTLKATELYRLVVDDGRVVEQETILTGTGRIRDIETAADGSILLLIEHLEGGQILRLVQSD